MELKLPELGENIASGDVIKVLVAPGDAIAKDQPVIEVETDKAAVEVPAPAAGKVASVLVAVGDKIKPGQVILTLEGANGAPAPEKKPAKKIPQAAKTPSPEPQLPLPEAPVASASPAAPLRRCAPAAAAPSVRKFAREIGVEIEEVRGSGEDGRVSIDDVKAYARARAKGQGGGAQPLGGGGRPIPVLPDFAKWGAVERKPMSGIRRKTAEHMSLCWNTIPHVTQSDKTDVTELEAVRKRYAASFEKAGAKLTVTAMALKICALALRKFPEFNASVDEAGGGVVYKNYVHIGVAVDTEHGLLVPVIRDCDKKDILQLALELGRAAQKARARKLSPEEMQGGCFTITNLGGIGGTAFTPIVNWPEAAILGLSRTADEAVFINGAFAPRKILPLSLSYDHRLIDGAAAARFLRWVADAFQQPLMLSLEGFE